MGGAKTCRAKKQGAFESLSEERERRERRRRKEEKKEDFWNGVGVGEK